jgi:ubiquitin C-terminal hydrolase
MHLSVDIPDKIPNGKFVAPYEAQKIESHDVRSLIQRQLEAELLDEENKWHCSQCDDKVKALKFCQFSSLPPILVVQLKRFRYDPVLVSD